MAAQAKTHVLSFDVGIRHLAYCRLSVPKRKEHEKFRASTIEIEEWDIIDLDRVPSVDVCCRRLMEELHKRFAFSTFDYVLIERQPKHRSIMMVAIQMFLCAYFHTGRVVSGRTSGSIRFIHASRKLEVDSNNSYGSNNNSSGIDTTNTSNSASQSYNNFNNKMRGRFAQRSKVDKQAAALRYKDNKRRAIESCTRYLTDVMQDYGNLALLEQYPKKDDLCDAFLQAVAFLESAKS
jgi:hypothetical protein